MFSKTLPILLTAGCLIVAAATLAPSRNSPTAAPKDDIGYGSHKPRYVKGKLLEGCFQEPAECGLVVW
jgi:hypothetical protein